MASTCRGVACSLLQSSSSRRSVPRRRQQTQPPHNKGVPLITRTFTCPLSVSVKQQPSSASRPAIFCVHMATQSTVVEEKHGVRVERNPPESRLSELGVRSWPKWGCPPSKFPWTYAGTETCYLLKGKVKVYLEGSSEYVEISAGDLVVFPDGMSCTWEVFETVDKHYSFS